MTPQQTLTVLIRLLILWVGIWFIRAFLPVTINSAITLFEHHSESRNSPAFAVTWLVMFAMCICLWRFSHRVADWLLRGTSNNQSVNATANTWFILGCSLLGLWLLSNSIPTTVLELTLVIWSPPSANTAMLMHVASDLIQITVGLLLLLGTKPILSVVTRAHGLRSSS
jgi:hypothetical protein